MQGTKQKKRNLLKDILKKNSIVCLTAYTAPITKLVDAYADLILVGDSLGPVLYGFKSTREVDMEMMIRHAACVVKNSKEAFIVVDMPYGSYEGSKYDALKNAKKLISSTGAMAVKLEGGKKISNTISFLTDNNINVMGHLGMLPQSLFGKPKVYGRKKNEKIKLFDDIRALERSGVFSVVIECTMKNLVDELVKYSKIPIIGIGASTECKGQIIVTEDILGMTTFSSKFSQKYFDFLTKAKRPIKKFTEDVRNKKYPKKKQCY